MAYVSVPKDLTKVKNKLVFNLTRRQLICFALAAAIGLPFYFLTREALGTTTSATCMEEVRKPDVPSTLEVQLGSIAEGIQQRQSRLTLPVLIYYNSDDT